MHVNKPLSLRTARPRLGQPSRPPFCYIPFLQSCVPHWPQPPYPAAALLFHVEQAHIKRPLCPAPPLALRGRSLLHTKHKGAFSSHIRPREARHKRECLLLLILIDIIVPLSAFRPAARCFIKALALSALFGHPPPDVLICKCRRSCWSVRITADCLLFSAFAAAPPVPAPAFVRVRVSRRAVLLPFFF